MKKIETLKYREIIVSSPPEWIAKPITKEIKIIELEQPFEDYNDFVIEYDGTSSKHFQQIEPPSDTQIEAFCFGVEAERERLFEIELEKEENKTSLQKKPIKEIFNNIKVSKHRYGVQLNKFPYELLDKIKIISSHLSDLETYDDCTDDEGVFLEKKGYKKLEKVIYHLNLMEKIIK